MDNKGWIGVDFDGTLVTHEFPEIGKPIWPMIDRVKAWLAQGQEVRIFTARVAHHDWNCDCGEQRAIVQKWCLEHFGQILPITCCKDMNCIAIYDDRAVQVETNTGRIIGED